MKTRNLLMVLLLTGVAYMGVAQSAGTTQLSREERSKIVPVISLPAPAVSVNQTAAEPVATNNLSREERSKIVPHVSLPAPATTGTTTEQPVVQQGSREERSKVVPSISLPAPASTPVNAANKPDNN